MNTILGLAERSESWPGLSRPSTSFALKARKKDVHARDNARIKSGDGRDGEEAIPPLSERAPALEAFSSRPGYDLLTQADRSGPMSSTAAYD